MGLFKKKTTVLVCDNEPAARRLLTDILSENGCKVVAETENGESAIEKYKKYKPNIVFMSVTMPGMDGISALKAIKAADAGAVVIMCGEKGSPAKMIEAVQSGAKNFIVKPYTADKVRETVKKVLR